MLLAAMASPLPAMILDTHLTRTAVERRSWPRCTAHGGRQTLKALTGTSAGQGLDRRCLNERARRDSNP